MSLRDYVPGPGEEGLRESIERNLEEYGADDDAEYEDFLDSLPDDLRAQIPGEVDGLDDLDDETDDWETGELGEPARPAKALEDYRRFYPASGL
jgi:hypothetical protein